MLVGAIATGIAVFQDGDDPPTAEVTVTWGGSEGHPACVYDPEAQSVDATLSVDGAVLRPDTVAVTVTAYADENTSKPVGSSSRSLDVSGTMHFSLVVTIPVTKAPHVDADGVAACSLSVD